jgi:hypothetical protein
LTLFRNGTGFLFYRADDFTRKESFYEGCHIFNLVISEDDMGWGYNELVVVIIQAVQNGNTLALSHI